MLLFTNPGLIDLTLISSFGVNVKPETTNPIGYFGTGLKYALAVLLRNGQTVTMWRDGKSYRFGTRDMVIRDKPFTFVTLTHPEGHTDTLSFTTDLGKNWELWCALRELFCNALDEGGMVEHVESMVMPRSAIQEGVTTFYVEGGLTRQTWANRHEFLLLTDQPEVFRNEHLVVYRGTSKYLFNRGIRVSNLRKGGGMYTYDLLGEHRLTEDRTLDGGDMQLILFKLPIAVAASEDAEFIRTVALAPSDVAESETTFCFSDLATCSQVFKDTVEELIKKRNPRLNRTLLAAYIQRFGSEGLSPKGKKLSSLQSKQLARAVEFCEAVGFAVSEYEIRVCSELDAKVMGTITNGVIMLAEQCFTKGTKYVASTLIEEYFHLKYQLRDNTYEMQTHLFDELVTMGERYRGEPL